MRRAVGKENGGYPGNLSGQWTHYTFRIFFIKYWNSSRATPSFRSNTLRYFLTRCQIKKRVGVLVTFPDFMSYSIHTKFPFTHFSEQTLLVQLNHKVNIVFIIICFEEQF